MMVHLEGRRLGSSHRTEVTLITVGRIDSPPVTRNSSSVEDNKLKAEDSRGAVWLRDIDLAERARKPAALVVCFEDLESEAHKQSKDWTHPTKRKVLVRLKTHKEQHHLIRV